MTTLYVIEQGAIVTKTDGRVVVRKDHQVLQDIPAINIERIVLFGNVHLTTPAVAFVLKEGIDVVYLSSHGTYRGRFQPPWAKDAHLRQLQYRASLDESFRLAISKRFIQGKLSNMAALCRRQKGSAEVSTMLRRLDQLSRRAAQANGLNELRGYEGAASTTYYKAFRLFLKQNFGFSARSHHPPRDPINALLSLGYTLLYNEIYALINVVGLDPYMGFFHEVKRGHAALASDLMEEWRPIIADSLVLFLVNRGELTGAHFRLPQPDQVCLTKEGLARFVRRYEDRLASQVHHPRLQKRLSYRQCLEAQVRHLVECILGKAKTYQPFQGR